MRAHQQEVEPDDVRCGHWLAAGLGAPKHLQYSAMTFWIQQSLLTRTVFPLGLTLSLCLSLSQYLFTLSLCLYLSLAVLVHSVTLSHWQYLLTVLVMAMALTKQALAKAQRPQPGVPQLRELAMSTSGLCPSAMSASRPVHKSHMHSKPKTVHSNTRQRDKKSKMTKKTKKTQTIHTKMRRKSGRAESSQRQHTTAQRSDVSVNTRTCIVTLEME